jgi:nucleotide-binding universal stress UspA family protein
MRILLATDGSPCSLAAAQSVAARPWPRGSQIRIIGVAESAAHVVEPWYFDREIMQSVIDQQIKEAKLSVASAQEIIQDSANLTSSTTVPLGVATGAILEEADNWKADLIVLGSHGRHGLGRLLIGSVSESVAIHARCSVEVVRKKTNED